MSQSRWASLLLSPIISSRTMLFVHVELISSSLELDSRLFSMLLRMGVKKPPFGVSHSKSQSSLRTLSSSSPSGLHFQPHGPDCLLFISFIKRVDGEYVLNAVLRVLDIFRSITFSALSFNTSCQYLLGFITRLGSGTPVTDRPLRANFHSIR